MMTRTILRLADVINDCCFRTNVPLCMIRLCRSNVCRSNVRGFRRISDAVKHPSTPILVRSDPDGIKISKLWKPFVFTVLFSGSTVVGAAIWEYERIREHTYKIINHYKHYRIKKTGWRGDMERWWKSLTEGQKMFIPICFLNLLVFLAWRTPAFHGTMIKYFCSNPASRVTCWPMILSTFSHHSFLHLAANMYVLHSFSTAIVEALGREQFLALYLSSGVVSSFASYLYKTMFNVPGLSLGASGAIMGVIGFICTQYPDTRLTVVFLPMYTFTAGVAIKVIMGLDITGCLLGWKYFDHAAHLGGALLGIFWQSWGNVNIWQKREPILKFWHDLRDSRKPR